MLDVSSYTDCLLPFAIVLDFMDPTHGTRENFIRGQMRATVLDSSDEAAIRRRQAKPI
jgi:hypothetical protein